MDEGQLKAVVSNGGLNEFLLSTCMDFRKFCEVVLGMDWGEHLGTISSYIDVNRRSAIIAPRGHGKTTICLAKIAHLCFFNKGLKILLVANAESQAKKNLRELKNMIGDCALLSKLIPDDRTASWSALRIETKTGCEIEARANTDNIRGGHYDLVFCDEVGQYDDKENFYKVLMPTINAKKGKIVCIGTPESKVDLLTELFAPDSGFKCVKFTALLSDGAPLWPVRFDAKLLDEIKRSMSSLAWTQEYMCDPIGDATSLFPFDLLEESFDSSSEFEVRGDFRASYFMAVDYASSPDPKADFTVWMVGKDLGNGCIKLVFVRRERGWEFQRQFDYTKELYQLFRPSNFVIDNGHVGVVFAQKLHEEGFRVTPVNFKSTVGKSNKRMDMLTKLRQSFESTKVVIPRKPQSDCIALTDVLIQELMDMGVSYTKSQNKVTWKSVGRHDDMVMALAMLVDSFGSGGGYWSIELV